MNPSDEPLELSFWPALDAPELLAPPVLEELRNSRGQTPVSAFQDLAQAAILENLAFAAATS